MAEPDFIPKNCKECINSKYKLEKPNCAYEQGVEHKNTYKYFKKTYDITIQQHLDMMMSLKKYREECLEKIRQQAIKLSSVRKALDIDNILSKIDGLSTRIIEIENGGKPEIKTIKEQDRILTPPKDTPEAFERYMVKKEKKPEVSREQTKEKRTPMPLKDRGWLMYVRNTKKENIEQYVNQLKAEKPGITDDQIKISVNAAGNYMIRYTLNPDII
jgi:hypothetical protein